MDVRLIIAFNSAALTALHFFCCIKKFCFISICLSEEQLSSQRREERLMSSAFHELGVRYFQLIAEKEKIANEYGAVLLKYGIKITSFW